MRLFIALNLPDQVRHDLWDAIEPLRTAGLPIRWVRPEGIHLTLKFLGSVADARAAELEAAVTRAALDIRPVPLGIEGFGVFPDLRSPRVLWAGLEAPPALELLQHQVERECGALGFPAEGRPFRPHVTLGRAARDAAARQFRSLEGTLAGLHFAATALVETLDLMQSLPQQGEGSVYQVRHRARLS